MPPAERRLLVGNLDAAPAATPLGSAADVAWFLVEALLLEPAQGPGLLQLVIEPL